MKPEVAEKLGEARDFFALTKTVLAMCEPYGPVHAFRLTHNRGAARKVVAIAPQPAFEVRVATS
jgi:hypothetical protein